MALIEQQSTVGVAPALVGRFLRQDELNFCLGFVESSLEKRQSLDRPDLWREVWGNYLVSAFGTSAPVWMTQGLQQSARYLSTDGGRGRRARLKDPETHQILSSMGSQALTLLMGGEDVITASARGVDDYEKGRIIARVLAAIYDQPGVYGTFYRAFLESFIVGASIIEVGFRSASQFQVAEVPTIDPMTGRITGTQFSPREVLHQHGPIFNNILRQNFYDDPNGTRINGDMEFAMKQFAITEQQALDLVDAGTYDREATIEAIMAGADGMPAGERGAGDKFRDLIGSNSITPKNRRLLIGFEGFGRVPINYPTGHTNRCITVLNGVVVRSHINPFIDGLKPWVEIICNPVPGRFDGFGPAEAVRFLQDSTDGMLMNITEGTNAMTRPALLAGAGFGGDPNRVRRRQINDVIPCTNPAALLPLPADYSAMRWAMEEHTRRKLQMREATGQTNPIQAIPSSDRQTATEISEMVRLASQKNDVMCRIIEKDNLPLLGKMTHSRLRQFVPKDSELFAILNGEPLAVPYEAIDAEADIRFSGTRQSLSKAQLGFGYEKMMSLMGQYPDLILEAPEFFVRMGRDILGIPDAEAIMARIVQRRQAIMEQMMAAQAQQAAGGSEEATGSSLIGPDTQAGQTAMQGSQG